MNALILFCAIFCAPGDVGIEATSGEYPSDSEVIPVELTATGLTNRMLDTYQVVIAWDPTVLEFVSVYPSPQATVGYWPFLKDAGPEVLVIDHWSMISEWYDFYYPDERGRAVMAIAHFRVLSPVATEVRILEKVLIPGEDHEDFTGNDEGLFPAGRVPSQITFGSPGAFIRGDTDGSGSIDIYDAYPILWGFFVYLPKFEAVNCYDAADANDDGQVDISDAITILMYLYMGRGALPAPFPERGVDPTEDGMGCSVP